MNPHRRAFLVASALGSLMAVVPRAVGRVMGYPRALDGPMVGASGPHHFSVWVRASGAFDVTLEYATDRDFRHVVTGPTVRAKASEDCCVVLRAEGLKPDTSYWYRLKYAGQQDKYQWFAYRTRTAPAGPADFRVAFGSCCRIQFDAEQPIWDTVRRLGPDLFFWLGDNIYGDSLDPEVLTDLYSRGRVIERLRPVLRSTPSLAIWDDHDYGYNNSDINHPRKQDSLNVFRRWWANPAYGEPGSPGVYFSHSHGGVDFFFLDGRYNRDPITKADTAAKSMLGARQKRWLKQQLKASTAPFKVLVSGVGWSSAENEEGGDSWAVFMTERNEIFDFIRDNGIGGVLCISGDSHMGELNCIPRSAEGGYDIYDFCSSPLVQEPANKNTRQSPEVRVRDTWMRSVNVGLLRFDMTRSVPTVTMTLHDVLGEPVWEPLVLTPNDLANGVRTWDRKSDPRELERLRRFKNDRGYYGHDMPEGWPDSPQFRETSG